MNIGEANAVNALIRAVMKRPAIRTNVHAVDACEFLAGKAHAALSAGVTVEQVREWRKRTETGMR